MGCLNAQSVDTKDSLRVTGEGRSDQQQTLAILSWPRYAVRVGTGRNGSETDRVGMKH